MRQNAGVAKQEGIMRTVLALAITAAITIPLASQAQQQMTLSCVKDITYSQAFLAKFPHAGAACNEVVMVNGQKWVRFNAEAKHVESNRLTVDFIDKFENPVSTMTFSFDPGAQVMLEDERHAPASKLEPGEKLLVWMPENRLGFYADPGAMTSQHFALVSESAPEKR